MWEIIREISLWVGGGSYVSHRDGGGGWGGRAMATIVRKVLMPDV